MYEGMNCHLSMSDEVQTKSVHPGSRYHLAGATQFFSVCGRYLTRSRLHAQSLLVHYGQSVAEYSGLSGQLQLTFIHICGGKL